MTEAIAQADRTVRRVTCIVCDAHDFVEKWPGLIRCESCGFLTADMETFGDEDFAALYGHDYFHGSEYHDYVAEKRITQRSFGLRMKKLDKFLRPDRHQRLLEIGSAYGFFLDYVRGRFESAIGVDVATDAVAYSQQQGLDVRLGDLAELPIDGPFDVVCMWDTIEHLPHPEQHLARVAEMTAPGALITVTTGDIGSPLARTRGRQWRLIHPPTHLHYFSEATLTKILDKHGFTVVHSSYCGGYRSLEFAANFVLTIRWNKPKLYNLVRRTGLLKFAPYVNLGDIRYIIAERR